MREVLGNLMLVYVVDIVFSAKKKKNYDALEHGDANIAEAQAVCKAVQMLICTG